MEKLKKIGVWGLGIVGTSVIRYLYEQGYTIGVMDKRGPSQEELAFLKAHNAHFYSEEKKELFFAHYDVIVPSAGIDLRPYASHSTKWLGELDLFQQATRPPCIAITGTVGKTSITHLLSQILTHQGLHVATAGNIGIGILDTLKQKADLTVLELSSFQLELAHHFAPDLAIITNVYANHLDRHATFENYFLAKYRLLKHQTPLGQALIPADLYTLVRAQPETATRKLALFSLTKPPITLLPEDMLYYRGANGAIIKEHQGRCETLASDPTFWSLSYPLNCLIIFAALDMLNLPMPITLPSLRIPDHRLQYITTAQGVDFYNDSKSTVPESTLAAITQLSPKPITLLLGGVSKGINRQPLFQQIPSNVTAIHCFGVEADLLHTYAQNKGFSSQSHKTLEQAFIAAVQAARAGDQILFSPSGASFDLFKSYQERGETFQALVRRYAIKTASSPNKQPLSS